MNEIRRRFKGTFGNWRAGFEQRHYPKTAINMDEADEALQPTGKVILLASTSGYADNGEDPVELYKRQQYDAQLMAESLRLLMAAQDLLDAQATDDEWSVMEDGYTTWEDKAVIVDRVNLRVDRAKNVLRACIERALAPIVN